MKLTKWIEGLMEPKVTNFRDAALDDLTAALKNETIRERWLASLVEELRAINVGVDKALRDGNMEDLPNKSVRRNTIVFCLNQILEVKQSLETELADQLREEQLRERRNAAPARFEGIPLEPFRKGEQPL